MPDQPQPRQQPGIACDECRKRKLRCDRGRPRCGTCVNAGVKCEITDQRLPRGPKKGTLKALRSRIQILEERLRERNRRDGIMDMDEDLDDADTAGDAAEDPVPITTSRRDSSASPAGRTLVQDSETPSPQDTGTTEPSLRSMVVDALTRADLDQLYFDRVHPLIPLLNKHRYYQWCEQENPGGHRIALQNAMWTLAMALSSQFEQMRVPMYDETRRILEAQELSNELGTRHIETVQALLLVTFYEFLRHSYPRAWFSAGKVFRLVQLLRLHEVDSPHNSIMNVLDLVPQDEIDLEEKRRAFWAAYCLDRFISPHNRLPLTLNEESIYTRLPAAELDFQNGNPVTTGCFLSEAMVSASSLSPFPAVVEVAILVTLYGRALAHANVTAVEQLYGNAAVDFWARHDWIDAILGQRMTNFAQRYSPSALHAEPMLLLAHLLQQATMLYLFKIMEPLNVDEHSASRVAEYKKKATAAAHEVASLAKKTARFGVFKAHVFTPTAIYLAAERLTMLRNSLTGDSREQEAIDSELKACQEALRRDQGVNNLAQCYLNLLKEENFYSAPLG